MALGVIAPYEAQDEDGPFIIAGTISGNGHLSTASNLKSAIARASQCNKR